MPLCSYQFMNWRENMTKAISPSRPHTNSRELMLSAVTLGVFVFFSYCWVISEGTEFTDDLLENLILTGLCLYGGWVVVAEYYNEQLMSPLSLFFCAMIL